MNKPPFPITATLLLVAVMLGTLGLVGGVFYLSYHTDYVSKKIAVIGHGIYLRTLRDPDPDKDGLSDVAETQIYHTDPKKFDSKQAGIGDGEYMYSVYRKAFVSNDESPLIAYRRNLAAYTTSFSLSNSSMDTTSTISLEDAFNVRSSETYNLYVGVTGDVLETLQQALRFRQQGDYEQSLSLLQDALAKNPDSSVLKYHLGLTYHGMKQYDKALQIYKSIENDPVVRSPLLYSDLASASYALGNGDELVRYLELSIKEFPEDLNQYLKLASYYQEINELDKAKEVLNEGLKIEPRYASYYNALAIIASLQGDNKIEFDLYKKAVSYDLRYAPGHGNLAILYDEYFNDFPNALIEALLAYELEPSARHLSRMVLLYYKTGETAKATKLESQLSQMGDIDSSSLNTLGLMYLDQANYGKAETYFRKAIAIDPSFPNAYNNLGIVLSDTGRAQESLANYVKAVELNPNYANAINNIGWHYEHLGQYQEAIHYFDRAIRMNPNLYRPYMNLGDVYRMLGDKTNAILNYNKALSLGATDPTILQNLKILQK